MKTKINNFDKKYHLLNITVNSITKEEILAIVGNAIDTNQNITIANHNLHSIYLYQRDKKMQNFYDLADYTYIDGMPIVILGKLLGFKLNRSHRTTSLDFIPLLLSSAVKNKWKLFYLGSKPGVAEKGANILRDMYPGLLISTHHGYFELDEYGCNETVTAAISQYKPNILIVGMGMPRQEHWILDNHSFIDANVIFPWGANIDYIAGEIPTPPRWMGRVGLEWLYRLISEPGRLWKRYLVEPWFLGGLFLRDLWWIRLMKKNY